MTKNDNQFRAVPDRQEITWPTMNSNLYANMSKPTLGLLSNFV